MTYQDTLQWLYKQLPMYQRQGKQAYKKDLSHIIKLDRHLGQASKKFRSIHIAGTNGKGSVSHMLASVLQEAGYKVGLYTSPHLKDFRERIRVNGQMIRKNCVINFVKKHQTFFKSNQLSFFEMTVGMAFDYFAKKQVDIAIIETGLGGRLDSTNIIKPDISIITNISFDHTAMLGATLEKIAFEKAGIIKMQTPVIIGKKQPETQTVFEQTGQQKNAPVIFASEQKTQSYQCDLKGYYQKENKHTALVAIAQMRQLGWNIPETALIKGLKNVSRNTGLRGRWEVLGTKPLIIADTAHNQDGLRFVLHQLKDTPYQNLHLILSFVNDKDLNQILPLFPKNAHYYFSKAQIPRALDENILKQTAHSYGLKGAAFSTIKTAFEAAKKNALPQDLIFIGGSTFTVAEVI